MKSNDKKRPRVPEGFLYVGSNDNNPTRIHVDFYDAKCANHDYIDIFSGGYHMATLKNVDGRYTSDF